MTVCLHTMPGKRHLPRKHFTAVGGLLTALFRLFTANDQDDVTLLRLPLVVSGDLWLSIAGSFPL